MHSNYQYIKNAILFIEDHVRQQPSLQEVADHVGLSMFHFQRLFTYWAGISPKRFMQYLTAQHCGNLLRKPSSALDTALDAGLSGPARLHELMVNVYAMTPEQYRRQGHSIKIEYGWQLTPFGFCLLARTKKGICWLSFHDRKDNDELAELSAFWPAASLEENANATGEIVKQIFERIYDQPQSISVHVKGTNLQIRVWEALLKIPLAESVSYSQVAIDVKHPRAVRAVASAVGRNPIGYIIPCHRVIRRSGALGGYRGGLPRKQVMQAWETAQLIDPD